MERCCLTLNILFEHVCASVCLHAGVCVPLGFAHIVLVSDICSITCHFKPWILKTADVLFISGRESRLAKSNYFYCPIVDIWKKIVRYMQRHCRISKIHRIYRDTDLKHEQSGNKTFPLRQMQDLL